MSTDVVAATVGALDATGAELPPPAGDCLLGYDGFEPGEERLREALTSTGNGYLCIRGSAEWKDSSEVHYPGAYAHGVYDRESAVLAGRPIPNEDLVNLPRCLLLKLSLDGEEPIRLGNGADPETIARHPAVWQALQREVDEANRKPARIEQVKRFAILDHDLTQANGELTPTPKVKRSIVYDKYADVFAGLYENRRES